MVDLDVEQLADDASPIGLPREVDSAPTLRIVREGSQKEGGDLYGVHTPIANDRKQKDADEAAANGQTWLEALEETAAEGGPEPEAEVDVVDENDLKSRGTDSKDRPVADSGSAGPRGL